MAVRKVGKFFGKLPLTMEEEDFTILELLDLSLHLPEAGVVNFNILHTVLTRVIIELKMDQMRTPCFIQNKALARSALLMARRKDPFIKSRKSLPTVSAGVEDASQTDIDEKDPLESERSKDYPELENAEMTKELEESHKKLEEKKKEFEEYQSKQAEQMNRELEESYNILADKKKELEESQSKQAEQMTKELEESCKKLAEKAKELEESQRKQAEQMAKDLEESYNKLAEMTKELKESQSNQVEHMKKLKESQSKSEITISLPDLSKGKDVMEVTDEEKAAEVREVAKDILEKTADANGAAKELLEGTTEEEAGKVAARALKVIAQEDNFQEDPTKVVQEMWRAIQINRRMDGAEKVQQQYAKLFDEIFKRLKELEHSMSNVDQLDDYFKRIKQLESRCKALKNSIIESDNFTRSEVERLEEVIGELMKELELSREALIEMQERHQSLSERVAYKDELEELKNNIDEEISVQVKKLKKRIRELQDATVHKEDFAELVQRVDTLESDKVGREELGRLLEPGFIDNFITEQENLRTELDELKLTVGSVDEKLDSLIKRIEEEILKDIYQAFEEIRATMDEMKEKLDEIDIEDINDSFARLEEKVETITLDLEAIKAAQEKFEKEAKANFKKISDVSTLIQRLQATKADKSKMYELLELKADLEMVMGKLDRSEFVSIMQDMEEKISRLTITVKINEEEMTATFTDIKKELSFKMYTEDFIIGTEPIRNRIKAMMYEQKKIKEIALQNFFPDAPGVAKCLSCKRAANLISSKFPVLGKVKASNEKNDSKAEIETTKPIKDPKEVRFPPVDIDEIPIPPPDHPRTRDIHQLPVLFANVRPQVGLAHEKRKKDIDKELAEYFSTGRLHAVGGAHTKTVPQQRGLTYTTIKLPQEKKSECLLTGLDKRYYKGTVIETHDQLTDQQELSNDASQSMPINTGSCPKTTSKQDLNQSKESGSKEKVGTTTEQGAESDNEK